MAIFGSESGPGMNADGTLPSQPRITFVQPENQEGETAEISSRQRSFVITIATMSVRGLLHPVLRENSEIFVQAALATTKSAIRRLLEEGKHAEQGEEVVNIIETVARSIVQQLHTQKLSKTA